MLEELMQNLYNEVIRAKIKFMISDIEKSEWASVFSMNQIAHELEKAKEKGLRVDDIEEMLFW
jgi:fructosamine-3-kinase